MTGWAGLARAGLGWAGTGWGETVMSLSGASAFKWYNLSSAALVPSAAPPRSRGAAATARRGGAARERQAVALLATRDSVFKRRQSPLLSNV